MLGDPANICRSLTLVQSISAAMKLSAAFALIVCALPASAYKFNSSAAPEAEAETFLTSLREYREALGIKGEVAGDIIGEIRATGASLAHHLGAHSQIAFVT